MSESQGWLVQRQIATWPTSLREASFGKPGRHEGHGTSLSSQAMIRFVRRYSLRNSPKNRRLKRAVRRKAAVDEKIREPKREPKKPRKLMSIHANELKREPQMSHDSHFSHSSYPSQLCHLPCAIRPSAPQSAKRSSLLGHPSCGGLGKPIGYCLSAITHHASPLTPDFRHGL